MFVCLADQKVYQQISQAGAKLWPPFVNSILKVS